MTKIDTQVYLTVDTANIDQSNKKDKVVFTDNRSDPAENPGHPEDYVSQVDRDKRIYWHGIVLNAVPNGSVKIINVSKKSTNGGSNILKKDSYDDPDDDGVVAGKVRNKNVTGEESYNISFLVNGTDTYTIDPKLIMNT